MVIELRCLIGEAVRPFDWMVVCLAWAATPAFVFGQLTAEWSEIQSLPKSLSNNAVAAVDNSDGTITLYSFMGIENPFNRSTVTASSYRINLPGGDWEAIADAPLLNGKAKIGSNAVTIAGEVYLVGGYTIGGPEVTESRLFRYDPIRNEYVQLADVEVEVDDTVVGVFENRYLYLVSGWHGPINENVRNVQIYDTVEDSWVQATPIPGPFSGLFGHAGGLVADKIFYMDGADSAGAFNINNQVFVGTIDPLGTGDITHIEWQAIPAHPGQPTYRAAPSSGATLNGGWLLSGGTNNPYNFSGNGYNGIPAMPLEQVLFYEPEIDSWTQVRLTGDHIPTMDHRGLVGCGHSWFTIGGMIAPGQTTASVYQLQFPGAEQPCFFRLGDINLDGAVDLLDIAPFVGLVITEQFQIEADINADGIVNLLDVDPFVSLFGN